MIADTSNTFILEAINNLQVILVANSDNFYNNNAPIYPNYIPTNRILAVFDDIIIVDNTLRNLCGIGQYLSFVPFHVIHYDGYMLYVIIPRWLILNKDEDICDMIERSYHNNLEAEQNNTSPIIDPYEMMRIKIVAAVMMAVQEKIKLEGGSMNNIPDIYKYMMGYRHTNDQFRPKSLPVKTMEPMYMQPKRAELVEDPVTGGLKWAVVDNK